jgi:ECF sigma factor
LGSHDLTDLLIAWHGGEGQALEGLIALVHDELHRLAQRCMAGERAGYPLQPTALVNEAYLRLIDSSRVRWQDRTHFLPWRGDAAVAVNARWIGFSRKIPGTHEPAGHKEVLADDGAAEKRPGVTNGNVDERGNNLRTIALRGRRSCGGEPSRSGYRSEAQRIALRSSAVNALFWNRSALCPNWKYTFRAW